jgi:hypothetical protein
MQVEFFKSLLGDKHEFKIIATNQSEMERLAGIVEIISAGGSLFPNGEDAGAKRPAYAPKVNTAKKPALAKIPEYTEEPEAAEELEDTEDFPEVTEDVSAAPAKRGPGRPPKAKAAAAPKEPEIEPEIEEDIPAKGAANKKYTLDEVLKAFQSKTDKNTARALLKEFQAVNVRALNPADYPAVMKKLAKIV